MFGKDGSPLILASASPRRRELLSSLGISFETVCSRFEEKTENLSPEELVLAFAKGKAEEVFSRFPNRPVLGADTVVAFNGRILGKPKDKADAVRMLQALSGNTHEVYTGVCLLGCGDPVLFAEKTEVTFGEFSKELISAYAESGLPLDKAGAYGIQDGYLPVLSIRGSYSNVVGLPLERVETLLKEKRLLP